MARRLQKASGQVTNTFFHQSKECVKIKSHIDAIRNKDWLGIARYQKSMKPSYDHYSWQEHAIYCT